MSASILNVNDNEATRYMLSETLRRAGYRVTEARNGQEALSLANDTYDLVVLDVRLPDLDGFEVCRRLRSNPETATLKVLHTSATFVSLDKRVEGLDAGADGYLTQPFERAELIAAVRNLLKLGSVERELVDRAKRLAENDRRKDEFLAMLAHELRNPLSAISMSLPLLAPASELERKAAEIIQRQTFHLARMVDDLLDVARVTQGKIRLQRFTFDMKRLVQTVTDNFKNGHRLIVQVPDAPVPMFGDENRIEQVVTNLLDNARKYSPPGTTITVRLDVDKGAARLRVRDEGVGLDAASLREVWQLFAQAHATLDRARGGLGIGLTLVRQLVELHGGSVDAFSDGLGQGSEFAIRLPLGKPLSVNTLPAEAVSAKPRRLLIVDDNDDARESLGALCELLGHTVTTAVDGNDGIARALADKPEVAIVDIGLPGVDGYEVARRIRASEANTYLIALTGYGSEESVRRAKDAGFDLHLVKPAQAETLRSILASASR